MFLLFIFVFTSLGAAFALLIDKHFAATDWRRWALLAPFWLLATVWALATHKLNMTAAVPLAIQAFAMGSLALTVIAVPRSLRRRRDTDTSSMAGMRA